MEIKCSECDEPYNIDGSKIPVNGGHLNCPKCETKFFVKGKVTKEEQITCPKCGLLQKSSETCKNCGIVFLKYAKMQSEVKEKKSVEKIVKTSQETNEQIKKFKVTKSNVIISIIIAVPHVLAMILNPMHPLDYIASFLLILVWSSLASWIVWRLSGRKEKGGSLTFKIVLIIILLSKLAQYGINIANENQNKSSLTETSAIHTEQRNNMDTNTAIGANSDEQKKEQAAKEVEAFVFDQIQNLGHKVKSVKLSHVVNIGPDYFVLILLYKTNDFVGAYFISPEAERFVIYDTDDDMTIYKSMLEMNEEDVKTIIRDDFKRLADFEFPSE